MFFIIAPPLAKQLSQLSLVIPQYLADNSFIIDNALLKSELSGPLQNLLVQASGYFKNITSSFFAGIFNLLGGVMSALLTIVISFYLIIEENGVERFVKNVIPQKMQHRSLNIIKKVQVKLGRWFVGQVSLGFIVGIMSYVGLYLLGITEYALVLAMIAGMLELVPYVGPILSAIPAIIIALTISLNDALLTFVLYFFIQQFENYLIVPKVMEKSVNLHPIIIILAIMIGGKLAGVMGAMLAVPVTAIITIILDDVNHNHAVN
jgi:predicted PurR-regulated permease PerM